MDKKKLFSLVGLAAVPAILTLVASRTLESGLTTGFLGALWGGLSGLFVLNAILDSYLNSWRKRAVVAALGLALGLAISSSIQSSFAQTASSALACQSLFAIAMTSFALFAVRHSKSCSEALTLKRKWLRLGWLGGIFATAQCLEMLGVPLRSSALALIMLAMYVFIIDPLVVSKEHR